MSIQQKIVNSTEQYFENSIIPSLMDYVRIPNLSRAYDPEWDTNGLLEKAAEHIKTWIENLGVKGLKIEIVKEEGGTPLIFAEIDRTDDSNGTILMYGHYDKQPHFEGWNEGLSPIQPKRIGDKIYGRGIADDGYAAYSSILAIKQCQDLGLPHPRCILTIEGEEESGSETFMTYLNRLKERIGKVDLVMCLDSGAVNYDTLWLTQSLRGVINVDVKVTILKQGQHSGFASGVVPTPFRVITQVINKLEDLNTGKMVDKLQVQIPEVRLKEIDNLVQITDPNEYFNIFPLANETQPVTKDLKEAIINRTWKSQLTVTGIDGLPSVQNGGNVIGESIKVKLSIRTPPSFNSKKHQQEIIDMIEKDTPYNCKVEVDRSTMAFDSGFNAAELNPQFQQALEQSCRDYFGREVQSQGEGGSIPLMVDLQEMFPNSQFLITGVLGPESNAHGPNEMLNVAFCKKLTSSMTQMVAEFSKIKH